MTTLVCRRGALILLTKGLVPRARQLTPTSLGDETGTMGLIFGPQERELRKRRVQHNESVRSCFDLEELASSRQWSRIAASTLIN